jgi:hypothetical protein
MLAKMAVTSSMPVICHFLMAPVCPLWGHPAPTDLHNVLKCHIFPSPARCHTGEMLAKMAVAFWMPVIRHFLTAPVCPLWGLPAPSDGRYDHHLSRQA